MMTMMTMKERRKRREKSVHTRLSVNTCLCSNETSSFRHQLGNSRWINEFPMTVYWPGSRIAFLGIDIEADPGQGNAGTVRRAKSRLRTRDCLSDSPLSRFRTAYSARSPLIVVYSRKLGAGRHFSGQRGSVWIPSGRGRRADYRVCVRRVTLLHDGIFSARNERRANCGKNSCALASLNICSYHRVRSEVHWARSSPWLRRTWENKEAERARKIQASAPASRRK